MLIVNIIVTRQENVRMVVVIIHVEPAHHRLHYSFKASMYFGKNLGIHSCGGHDNPQKEKVFFVHEYRTGFEPIKIDNIFKRQEIKV